MIARKSGGFKRNGFESPAAHISVSSNGRFQFTASVNDVKKGVKVIDRSGMNFALVICEKRLTAQLRRKK